MPWQPSDEQNTVERQRNLAQVTIGADTVTLFAHGVWVNGAPTTKELVLSSSAGWRLPMSPAQARALATRLVEGADLLDSVT